MNSENLNKLITIGAAKTDDTNEPYLFLIFNKKDAHGNDVEETIRIKLTETYVLVSDIRHWRTKAENEF